MSQLIAQWQPLVVAVSFYVLVFSVSELARRLADRLLIPAKGKKSGWSTAAHSFIVEFVAAAQMCTCVYENGVVLRNYGLPGFFLAVVSLGFGAGIFNRGAFVSPLAPIEQFYYDQIDSSRFLSIVSAQALGGYSAFRVASTLWYYSSGLSDDHLFFLQNPDCSLVFRAPFWGVLLWEAGMCGVIRILLDILPRFLVPFLISGSLTAAFVVVGVPGLNPTTISARMFGCRGLDSQWFVATYWIAPVIGWLLAAALVRRYKRKAYHKKATTGASSSAKSQKTESAAKSSSPRPAKGGKSAKKNKSE